MEGHQSASTEFDPSSADTLVIAVVRNVMLAMATQALVWTAPLLSQFMSVATTRQVRLLVYGNWNAEKEVLLSQHLPVGSEHIC